MLGIGAEHFPDPDVDRIRDRIQSARVFECENRFDVEIKLEIVCADILADARNFHFRNPGDIADDIYFLFQSQIFV